MHASGRLTEMTYSTAVSPNGARHPSSVQNRTALIYSQGSSPVSLSRFVPHTAHEIMSL